VARKRKRKQEETEAAGFDEQAAAAPERQRMTPVDIQQKVFRLAFRGYNERDVDEFLDRITEDLAALHEENKRLREQVAEGGGAAGDVSAADRQAEAIVRQAREHAARLVEDAEQRAAAIGTVGAASAPGLPASFLLQERQFLEQMASLVQGHARRLKEEARRARAAADEPASAVPATAEPGAPSEGAAAVGGAAGAVGGAAAGAASDATADEPSPERALEEPQSPPVPPEEATAPWSPIGEEEEEEEEEARSPAEGAGEAAEEGDPLVSAWEGAFGGDPGDRPSPNEDQRREEQQGEPSLRELFWGEE
jgi:DivIVA domain-containing protein